MANQTAASTAKTGNTPWTTPFTSGISLFFWICVGGVALALVMMIVTGVKNSREHAALLSAPVALPADGNVPAAPVAPAGIPVPASP